MIFNMTSMDGSAAGSLELSDAIFGLEPRADLIARMVRWQLAKRRAGAHKTLGRSEINRTGKKMYKQKGTGGARHGSAPSMMSALLSAALSNEARSVFVLASST